MSSEPIRIFHSRVAKENGSNGTRRYTVREKLSNPSRGLVWTLGRGALASGAGSLLRLEVSHVCSRGRRGERSSLLVFAHFGLLESLSFVS